MRSLIQVFLVLFFQLFVHGFLMVYNVLSMVFMFFQWFSMVFNACSMLFQWFSMFVQWFSQTVSMVFNGFSWFFHGFQIYVHSCHPNIAKTYQHNFPDTNVIVGDITDKKIKQQIYDVFSTSLCDVVLGGPPCVAYSMSGKRNSRDPRGKLFNDYVEIVKKLKPKVFIMENVKGILTFQIYPSYISNLLLPFSRNMCKIFLHLK